MIQILYFARFREVFGQSREHLEIPADGLTAAQLLELLRTRGGVWAESLAPERNWRIAVNQEMAELSTRILDGDEVAIFPPVTGG